VTDKKALAAVLGLVALGPAVLAGCTSAPDDPPPPATSSEQAAPITTQGEVDPVNCADAPEEVVGAALRLNLSHPRETVDGSAVTCRYEGGGVETSVRFRTGADAGAFAEGKERAAGGGRKVKDLPGFHDEAYTATLGTGEVVENTLVARKGPVEIAVTSGANFEQEKKLVSELFERI